MPKKTSGLVNMGRWLIAAGLALIFIFAGSAARSADGWKQEGLAGFFRCEIPRDWWAGASSFPTGDISRSFSGGLLRIRVEHLGYQGPGPRTPREYLTLFEPDDRKFVPGAFLEVSGRSAQRWSRRYTVRPRTHRGSGPEEWVYEEVVFLEGHNGFWALRFSSDSAVYRKEPQGLAIWHRFLKSFQLL